MQVRPIMKTRLEESIGSCSIYSSRRKVTLENLEILQGLQWRISAFEADLLPVCECSDASNLAKIRGITNEDYQSSNQNTNNSTTSKPKPYRRQMGAVYRGSHFYLNF